MVKSSVSDETIALLRLDWIGGVHVRDMMVKHGVTRGTIYGLNGRNGWPERDYVRKASPIAPPANRPRPRTEHSIQHAVAQEPKVDLVAMMAHDARMARPGLRDGPTKARAVKPPVAPPPPKYGRVIACLWPIGHPGKPDFRSCDDPSESGRVYCATHAALAYQKSDPKRLDAGLTV